MKACPLRSGCDVWREEVEEEAAVVEGEEEEGAVEVVEEKAGWNLVDP